MGLAIGDTTFFHAGKDIVKPAIVCGVNKDGTYDLHVLTATYMSVKTGDAEGECFDPAHGAVKGGTQKDLGHPADMPRSESLTPGETESAQLGEHPPDEHGKGKHKK